MRIESALNTSREGMIAHGQAIAVVGDNISNSNTTAYKAGRPEFADIMGEAAGTRVSGTVAGAGDGVAMSRVRTVYDGGPIEQTGRELDIGISGGGFLMIGDPANPNFTRAGALEINADGNLATANGQVVLGFQGGATDNLGPIDMYAFDAAGAATTEATIFGNLDSNAGLVTAPAAAPATFQEISATASFTTSQAVYDSLGTRHDVLFGFFKTGVNTWTVQAYADGGDVGGTAGQPTLLGQGTLTFGADGAIADANKGAAALTLTPAWAGGAAAGNFTVDFGSMKQMSAAYQITNITQDGKAVGTIKSYEFAPDGKIYAGLDSGNRVLIGSLPLALLRNNDGLQRTGSSILTRTQQAGELTVGAAGEGLRGTIEGRSLERSNVDIAGQFVDLVVFQRGYQANSQVLSAASEMLQNTIGLIR
jgi:flagellar hook protein FlgE